MINFCANAYVEAYRTVGVTVDNLATHPQEMKKLLTELERRGVQASPEEALRTLLNMRKGSRLLKLFR